MASEEQPDSTSASTARISAASSSGVSTSPVSDSRSGTSWRRWRGTSASGISMKMSYSSYFRSRPISSTSRKPSVVIRPVFAPLRSISALVNSVVACTTRWMRPASIDCASSSLRIPSTTPRAGSSGVVDSFQMKFSRLSGS